MALNTGVSQRLKFGDLMVRLVDLVFPRFCLECGVEGSFICPDCRRWSVVWQHQQVCHVCKQEIFGGLVHAECQEYTALDGVFVAASYQGAVKAMVAEAKYHGVSAIWPEIGQLMCLRAREIGLPEGTTISWAPTHWWRAWQRGWDQAELLAKAFDPAAVRLLARGRYTARQVGQNKAQRLINLRGTFKFVGKSVPETVLLFDDVMTTGSTLQQCAHTLKAAGVKRVYAYVWARG